ncbi:hypothetical protein GCM10027020_11470 [Nocardioides salsibiostraticola]
MTAQPLSRRRALGAAAGVGVGLPALAACAGEDPAPSGDTQDTQDTPDAPVEGGALTTVGDVPIGGGVILGETEIVVTQPTKGDFRGFSAICTHQGCIVREVTETIDCFCHGAKYSLESGEPVSGPANVALAPRDLRIEGDDILLV